MTSSTDRIEKTVVLRATLERVWRAISDSHEFGTWFGAEFEGPFVARQRVSGKIVPTELDPEVAKAQEAYRGFVFECAVERVEPMRVLSFRWHPYPLEPGAAFESAPTTLVMFELSEVEEGTRLVISESGFDQIPLERRAKAFADNQQGWAEQTRLIEKYVTG
jgi:uncharacterized protein YndB with AHSA1/START domain